MQFAMDFRHMYDGFYTANPASPIRILAAPTKCSASERDSPQNLMGEVRLTLITAGKALANPEKPFTLITVVKLR